MVRSACVRHFTGENFGGVWAQAKRGRIYACVWTPGHHRIVLTKAKGENLRKTWKRWYERRGWTVKRNIATNPSTGERHAIVLHEYDAETKERIV